ncbi:MAG: flagellar protein [Lachnospira sp.]|nr:flagellar protein [Lachnospira sp.]
MKINNFTSIEQISGQYLNNNNTKVNNVNSNEVSFKDLLEQKRNMLELQEKLSGSKLKFSKHAGERLADRNIELSKEQLERLEQGAKKAEAKGIKDSLVLMDDFAFIVNTKSNTVITAMDQRMEEDNVYTNIDGAVVI